MPKLDRWLVASKMVVVFDAELLRGILDVGATIGGGWCQVHQHVCVNARNKERIEAMLKERGFDVAPVGDKAFVHPEFQGRHEQGVPQA